MEANATKTQGKPAVRRNDQQDVIRVVREMVSDDMGFKVTALRELKKAVIWVPILLTTGIGVLWANKRFFSV